MSGIIASVSLAKNSYYVVSTPVYQGPLDLLLSLIEHAELDITKLAIAQVTDQYLQHMHTMQESQPGEVSAFLVMAARLLQIKSEVLLPRQVIREPGEEDLGEALARQLIIYKRFRDIASYLSARETRGLHTYLRLAPPQKIEGLVNLDGITLQDLFIAAQEVYAGEPDQQPLGDVVAPLRITIREKIWQISHNLRSFGRFSFSRLFSDRPSTIEIVVTFLAVLELIKRQLVVVEQQELFGEIIIDRNGQWDENDDFELEFGE